MSTATRYPIVMRDTRAWQTQVWISFALAVSLCAIGLSYLPGQTLERAFMVMGYAFCLVMVFVLSKSIRDTQQSEMSGGVETPMWRFVVWGGFLTAVALTGWGLSNMTINDTYRAFLGVSLLFLVSSAFTLAKTLRDRHEADLLDDKITKTERSQESKRTSPTPVVNNP